MFGETTNQEGVLEVGETLEELKKKRWVEKTTNQKGVLGVGKTQKNQNAGGDLGNDKQEGGPRGE